MSFKLPEPPYDLDNKDKLVEYLNQLVKEIELALLELEGNIDAGGP